MDLLEELRYECWSVYNNEFVTQIQRLEKAKVKQSDIRSKLSLDKQIDFDKLCVEINKQHTSLINELKTLRDKHSQHQETCKCETGYAVTEHSPNCKYMKNLHG